jgi:ATP-dependent DNA ligase
MLKIKSPMLSERIDKLKKEQQDEVWNSEEWDMEQKFDGIRCFIVNSSKTGIHLYSRQNSEKTLLPIEFTDRVYTGNQSFLNNLTDFILDCEITSDKNTICSDLSRYSINSVSVLQVLTSLLRLPAVSSTHIQKVERLNLVFNIFDCLYYDGKWFMNEPLSNRRKIVDYLYNRLLKLGYNVRKVPHTNKNKSAFYQSLISNGFEGVIAKRLNGIYVPDSTRNFNGWIKVKRGIILPTVKNTEFDNRKDYYVDDNLIGEIFGDTIDTFITGFRPGKLGSKFEGLVESVITSAYVKQGDSFVERVVAEFSSFSLDMRRQMTEIVNGQPMLKPEYYNRVVELDLGEFENDRLVNCVFWGFREDKNPDGCVVDKSIITGR